MKQPAIPKLSELSQAGHSFRALHRPVQLQHASQNDGRCSAGPSRPPTGETDILLRFACPPAPDSRSVPGAIASPSPDRAIRVQATRRSV
jgi:hypothetical protein